MARIRLPDFKRDIAAVAPASPDEETLPSLQSGYVPPPDESRAALVAAVGFAIEIAQLMISLAIGGIYHAVDITVVLLKMDR